MTHADAEDIHYGYDARDPILTVQVATFARNEKQPLPIDPKCPSGMKGKGPATSKFDLYPTLTVVALAYHYNVSEKTIHERWAKWTQCYGDAQCSDFVHFLGTGTKKKWPFGTSLPGFCGE